MILVIRIMHENLQWDPTRKSLLNAPLWRCDVNYSTRKIPTWSEKAWGERIVNHTYIHNCPLQPFSQDYWPSFSHNRAPQSLKFGKMYGIMNIFHLLQILHLHAIITFTDDSNDFYHLAAFGLSADSFTGKTSLF